MLLGGGRSALRPLNDENAVENRNILSSGKHGANSAARGPGVFKENSFRSSSKSIGGGGGSKKARGLTLAPKTPSGGSTQQPRRALGDISNRRVRKDGGGAKSSAPAVSKFVGARPKNATFRAPNGRTTFSVRTDGAVENTKKAKTPSHRGRTPAQQQKTPGALLSAHARVRSASFLLPKRSVTFENPADFLPRNQPTQSVQNQRPKVQNREQSSRIVEVPLEPADDVELPAGKLGDDMIDAFFNDKGSYSSADEIVRGACEDLEAIREGYRKRALIEEEWVIEERDTAYEKKMQRELREVYEFDNLEDLIVSLDVGSDFDDPILHPPESPEPYNFSIDDEITF